MGITKPQIATFRKSLTALQTSLNLQNERSSASREVVALDQQSVGRLSRMDAMQQQQMANAEARRREQMLMRIDAAFIRMNEDEYGYCQSCGEDIPHKRLEIDPTAHQCIECAR